jgi:1,4-dihydroxy-2-naphthoyl-CoA hydrolase
MPEPGRPGAGVRAAPGGREPIDVVWAHHHYPDATVSQDLDEFRSLGQDRFPGFLGIEVLDVRPGATAMRLEIRPHHVAPNGYLHAGVVVGLADSACGYGCVASLPDGAVNFATVEVKTNFLRTVTEGTLDCRATMVHGGRTTQLWDAEVREAGSDRLLALFRCTQLILYPDRR